MPRRACSARAAASGADIGSAIPHALCPAIATNFRATTSIIRTSKPNGGTTPGNVKSADGHRFGFELTFFRQGVESRRRQNKTLGRARSLSGASGAERSGWRASSTTPSAPAAPDPALQESAQRTAASGMATGKFNGRATNRSCKRWMPASNCSLDLRSEKPPVINGENGVSQKAEGPGRASHYISLTRLATNGRIVLAGKTFDVTGLAWMDHEFFTHQLETQSSRMGLVQRAARRQHGTDALSHSPQGWLDRPLFRRYIRRCARSEHAFAFKRLHAAASGRHLDELGHESDVSDSLENIGSTIWHRVGGEDAAAFAGAGAATHKLSPSYWEGAVTFAGRETARSLYLASAIWK